MAKFGVADADNYGGQGGGGYFSLKNDKEVAQVRFLYDTIEDVEGYAVHEVEIDGKKRWVNCLREYGQPMSDCPFCAKGMFTAVKYFVPLYNVKTNKIETWERGKKFGSKLSSMCARYPHLVSNVFEIERNGKPGDTATQYEIYHVSADDKTLEDFGDVPSPLGTHILDKSADEMQYFLDRGVFPDGGEAPVRRASASREDSGECTRRTPANTRERF